MALFRQLLSQNITTLTIESTDLRILTTRRGRVDRWKSVPLPAGLVSEGLITDEIEMGNILNALFTVERLDRRRVITGLSGLRAISRILTLPKLQPSLMEQAIFREARKEMPLPLEDLYLSWQSMPTEPPVKRTVAFFDGQNLFGLNVLAPPKPPGPQCSFVPAPSHAAGLSRRAARV